MATMIRIHKDDFGEIMEHLYKVKKHLKKACELIETGEEGSRRGGGRMNRRNDGDYENRFDDEDDD